MPRKPFPALASLIWLGLIGLGGATVLTFLGRVHWFFDLFTHFPLQLASGLSVIVLAAVCLRQWRAAALAIVFLTTNLIALSYYFPTREFPELSPDLRVVFFNVLTSNHNHASVRDYLTSTEADLIVLVETDRRWLAALSPLESDYPYVLKAPRGDNFGMALYSRYPIESHQLLTFEGSGVPCLHAVVTVEGERIEVVCGHPVPPVGALGAASRNAYLEALTELVTKSDRPTIVAGDFNATVWSPFFRNFLEATALKDTGHKRGLQATWKRGHPLFSIPIDHILYSRDLTCTCRKIGPALGSDHRPVVAELALGAD